MDIKAKLRPFYVAKMLYEQTDEDHYLTIAQIMEQLEKDYGISTSRGTVGDDIKALQELGVEIEVVPSTQKRFSLIGRRFDMPELKTLIDAVESANQIVILVPPLNAGGKTLLVEFGVRLYDVFTEPCSFLFVAIVHLGAVAYNIFERIVYAELIFVLVEQRAH